MSAEFGGRYQAVVLGATSSQVEKRRASVLEVSNAFELSQVTGLVEALWHDQSDGAYLAKVREACKAHDESFPQSGSLRELKHLTLEVALTVLSSEPNPGVDALALALATSSWQRDLDADIQLLVTRGLTYLKVRQRELRETKGLLFKGEGLAFPAALQGSGLLGTGANVVFSQLQPMLEALASDLESTSDGGLEALAIVNHRGMVVDERTGIIAACLSQFSEACDALYETLGQASFFAAAYDLAQLTRFDVGPTAARYYLRSMVSGVEEAVHPSVVMGAIPAVLRSTIAEKTLSSDITPVCYSVRDKGAPANVAIVNGFDMALQVYNELLVSRVVRRG